MTTTISKSVVNGVDTEALWDAIQAITDDPSKGRTSWKVTSQWKGGTRSDTAVKEYRIGEHRISKNFVIKVDEPYELCGTNQHANPQEYLLAALNACMIVGYSTACAMQGIRLDELTIETEGDIDLRGFLGLDPTVKPGYDSLKYVVHLKGDASPEKFREIHETIKATSPNRFNIATAIALNSELVVG